jgi:hypothetical protein
MFSPLIGFLSISPLVLRTSPLLFCSLIRFSKQLLKTRKMRLPPRGHSEGVGLLLSRKCDDVWKTIINWGGTCLLLSRPLTAPAETPRQRTFVGLRLAHSFILCPVPIQLVCINSGLCEIVEHSPTDGWIIA